MATIKDVAARAGVSPSTVSYALSGKRPISPTVRARIDAAVAALGYRPSPAARHLRKGQTGAVGMLFPLPDVGLEWVGLDFVSAAAEVLGERYTLSLLTGRYEGEALLERVRGRVDGLIVMEIELDDPRVALLQDAGLPFVMIGRTADPAGLSYVDFDYQAAAREAAVHLARLGHREVGVLEFSRGAARRYGFTARTQAGLTEAAAATGLRLHRVTAGPDTEAGMVATNALLERHPDLSAVLALQGSAHVGALRALRARGLRVPQDLSLVGLSPRRMAEFCVPRLTSVDVPLAEMGRQAAQALLEMLEEPEAPPFQRVLGAKLVVRESSAVREVRSEEQEAGSGEAVGVGEG